jgi:hypothetical protein
LGLLGLGAFLSLSASACGGSDGEPQSSQAPLVFTGTVADTDVRVGVVASGRHARLYFCGTGSSLSPWTRWLSADRSDTGAISFPSDGWELSGSLQGTVLDGTVAPAAAELHRFHAVAARAGSLFGLYEADAPCGKVGLIVGAGGTPDAPSAQGACSGANPESDRQVIPIMPIARTSSGTIGVTVAGDAQVLQVAPAAVIP